MTGRKSFTASAGITTPIAAIVIVIIVCGSAFGIVELQLLSTDSGRSVGPTSTVTTTVTTETSPQLTTRGLTVSVKSLRSSDFLSTNAGITFTCGAAAGSFVTVSNTGTAGANITGVTINLAESSDHYSLAAGSSCSVGAAGSASATQNILFASATKLFTSATAGSYFQGYVAYGSGGIVPFDGTFQ